MSLQNLACHPFFRGPQPGTQASRIILWFIGFFAFLNVYGMQAILPLIKKDFQTTSAQAGIVVGITLFAVAMISPWMGMLSDKIGRKNVICYAMVSMTVPAMLIPLCNNLLLLMMMRFLQGLAIPGIIVSTVAYIAEEFSGKNIVRMTTAYVGGAAMGGFSGRFIAGHAAELLASWQGGFVLLAFINIAGIFLILKLLPPSQNFKPNANIRQGLTMLGKHLKNTKLLATCVVGFCVLFSLVAMFTYVNFLLDRPPFNLNSADLANVFCVYLMGIVITPLSARFISKLGYQRALISALVLASTGLCLTLIPSLFWVIAGLAISASGIFICQSASIGYLVINVSEGRSLASGIYNLAYYLGGAVGAWVVGIAFDAYQWTGSVVTIIAVQVVAATIAWFCWKPVHPASPNIPFQEQPPLSSEGEKPNLTLNLAENREADS